MSIVEYVTEINWRTVQKMKRHQLEQSLVHFADKSVKEEAQIAQLTAEVERLKRVVEQATKRMVATKHGDESGFILLRNVAGDYLVASETQSPDLYAHLEAYRG